MSVATVHIALTAVLDADLTVLTHADLRSELAALVREGGRVQAAVARRTAELASRAAAAAGEDDVTVGVSDTVSSDLLPTPAGGAEAARMARRGHAVKGLPKVSALHADGQLSTPVLDAAATGLTRLDVDVWPSLDEQVAAAAATVTPAMVARLVEQLRSMTLPETVNGKARSAEQRRGLWITRRDDGPDARWSISGDLYGLRAERAAGMINDWSRPHDGKDERTPEQRRADALYDICDAAANGAASSVPRPDSRLLIIAPLSAVRGEPGAPGGVTADGNSVDPGELAALRCTADIEVLVVEDPAADPDSDEVDRSLAVDEGRDEAEPRAEAGAAEAPETGVDFKSGGGLAGLGDGPDPGDRAEHAVCADGAASAARFEPRADGARQARLQSRPALDSWAARAERDAELLRRALIGLVPESLSYRVEPLVYARGRRLASLAQRAVLVVRDQGCVKCGRAARWCVSHHIREYDADGGATDVVNMALLCVSCHTDLHRRGMHLHPPWCLCGTCGGSSSAWTEHHFPAIVEELCPDDVETLADRLNHSQSRGRRRTGANRSRGGVGKRRPASRPAARTSATSGGPGGPAPP